MPSPHNAGLLFSAPFLLFRGRTASSVIPFFSNDGAQEKFRDVPDLKPGETIQVKLQERYYDAFYKGIEKLGLSNSSEIKEARIWVETVVLSDGTLWKLGKYVKPNPNDPTKYIPIEKVS